MIAQYIDAFDAKHGRVIIQADTMPAVFPARGRAVDGLPDDYILEPGSVLYVLGNGEKMTTWILGADSMWHSTGTDSAKPAGGVSVAFHLLKDDDTPYTTTDETELYIAIARTAFVTSQDPADIVVLDPIVITGSSVTYYTDDLPADPDEYLIRFSDGQGVTDCGYLADGALWTEDWYDGEDTTLADRVAYKGGDSVALDYIIRVTPTE